jgi:hypothetical protein
MDTEVIYDCHSFLSFNYSGLEQRWLEWGIMVYSGNMAKVYEQTGFKDDICLYVPWSKNGSKSTHIGGMVGMVINPCSSGKCSSSYQWPVVSG